MRTLSEYQRMVEARKDETGDWTCVHERLGPFELRIGMSTKHPTEYQYFITDGKTSMESWYQEISEANIYHFVMLWISEYYKNHIPEQYKGGK